MRGEGRKKRTNGLECWARKLSFLYQVASQTHSPEPSSAVEEGGGWGGGELAKWFTQNLRTF